MGGAKKQATKYSTVTVGFDRIIPITILNIANWVHYFKQQPCSMQNYSVCSWVLEQVNPMSRTYSEWQSQSLDVTTVHHMCESKQWANESRVTLWLLHFCWHCNCLQVPERERLRLWFVLHDNKGRHHLWEVPSHMWSKEACHTVESQNHPILYTYTPWRLNI